MNEHTPLLSIVTPTYNRAELLRKCYDSLMAQSDKSFEWIIVDDGSTDHTREVVDSFRPEFKFTYVRKENGGKHTALNASHPHIHGEYVLILDSDDSLTDTAVAQVHAECVKYLYEDSVGVIIFLRGKNRTEPLCTVQTYDVPVDMIRIKRNRRYSSDCCEVIRTELFKKYPFPVFEGERFVSEGALWNRVGFTHKCVYINKVIYLCEYLEGGLTKSGRAMRVRNPQGGMYTTNLNMHKRQFLKTRIKNGLLYTCYGFFAGLPAGKILTKDQGNLWIKALCIVPGYMIHRLWKKKYF